MLVWGAWREALDRALAAHRAALGRHAALAGLLQASAVDPHQLAEAARRISATTAAALAAAEALPGGWLGDAWPQLSAARPAPGGHDPADLVPVRIGVAHPTPDTAVPLRIPLLGQAHLAIAGPVLDPQVAATFQTVLTRVLGALPAGSVRVVAHDPAGLGRVFTPFQALIDAGVIVEVGAGRDGLLAALDQAESQVRQVRANSASPDVGRRHLLLALTGLPAGSGEEAETRLAALAHAGPAAGVSLLLAEWPPPRPPGYAAAPFLEATTHLTGRDDGWAVTLPGARSPLHLPVQLDSAPPDDVVDAFCGPLARAATEQAGSSFGDLLADPPWQQCSADGLATPIGRVDRADLVLRFDDATPHWLVGGRSGSGKTVFLLDVLAGLSVRYPPSELALYLLDFKEGVSFAEFTPTARDPSWIPQTVAVGIESDREYGVAVLRTLQAEMSRRALEFKRAGVTKLAQLRQARPELVMPRVLAVIDEFQVLFTGHDDITRQATELLEDLARKGRSYGVHLVLASQTTSGIEALQTKIEAIFGQFPMRIALAGGGGVLDPLNSAADGLTIGSAVVNVAAGIPAANTVVRLPFADPEQVALLRRRLWLLRADGSRPPAVFAGFEAQHLTGDPDFAALAPGRAPRRLLLGRSIDVGSPTASVPIDATPGRHLAVVGPSPVGADILHAAVVGLGRQHRPGQARFLLAALTPAGADAAEATRLALADAGQQPEQVGSGDLTTVLADLSRFRATGPERPTYLALFGADAAGPTLTQVSPDTFRSPADDLRTVIQQGPPHGIHVLGWWQSLGRLGTDLGPNAREDVACLVVLNIPGTDLQAFLGRFDLQWDSRPNRALLWDRHTGTTQVIVPFVRPTPRDDEEAR